MRRMTTSPPEKHDGPRAPKRVRKKLADGTYRVYEYARKPKPPSRFHQRQGHAIRELAAAYSKSPEFRALSEQWRWATFYYLGLIEDGVGWMTQANLEDPRARGEFYKLRDDHADKPFKADKLIGVLCTLLAWGYERRKIAVNHAQGIDRLVKGPQRADKIWTEEQIAALLAVADSDISRLVRFALLTATRRGDIQTLDWAMLRDGWLTFTPQKTSKMIPAPLVRLPVRELEPLAALLDEIGGTRWPSSGLIFATETRKLPWTTSNFAVRWRTMLIRAGLRDADRHFHDLRGTAITRLLEAGCSDAETAAISGHVLGGRSTLRAYASRTDAMALSAFRKLNKWYSDRPRVIDLTTARKPAGNRG